MQLADPPVSITTLDVPASRSNVSRTILIVEDDTHFLPVLREMLRRLGYRVFTATDVSKAEETWAQARTKIDAVICDQVLGFDRGSDLVQRFRVHNPKVRFVLCSGSPPPAELPGVAFLPKPFDVATLLSFLS